MKPPPKPKPESWAAVTREPIDSNQLAVIKAGLELILQPFAVAELRALEVTNNPSNNYGATWSGYFDNVAQLAAAAVDFSGRAMGVYVTLNPVDPDLLARAANTIVQRPKHTTTDRDVTRRRWLPIDFDPVRKAAISASNEERTVTLDCARACRQWLQDQGWPSPVLTDSGNGYYLLYRIDLPNDDVARQLVQDVLTALACHFSNEQVVIDTAMYTAARLWKIPGTMACKGSSTADRPHRLARLLDVPKTINVVPRELLEQLAKDGAGRRPTAQAPPAAGGGSLDELRRWINRHNLTIKKEAPWKDGYKFVLAVCPFNAEHNRGEAVIVRFASGYTLFKCQHGGCKDKTWNSLLQLLTPSAQSNDTVWPAPTELGGQLPPVQVFNLALLPAALRPLVEDVANRMQVPLDFPAVATIFGLSVATSRRAHLQCKRIDPTWTETPNLWAMIVASPGRMKSPTIAAMTAPLNTIEASWRQEYAAAQVDYARAAEEAELCHNVWREQYKVAQKAGKPAPPRPDRQLLAPQMRRLLTHDATYEKLHEILAHNPAGIGLIRDELAGWLAMLDKEGHEGARAFFLTAWNGDSSYIVDRMGRGTVYGEHCCVSILGGITPARLASYMADVLQDGPTNDGLLQRFQLAVYPDDVANWRYVDRVPNQAAILQARQMYERLVALDVNQPLHCTFDPAAQELFIAWLSELEAKLRSPSTHPALVAHLAKYQKLMPALALLFELADGSSQTAVRLEHAQQAAAWCDHMESHARRIYSMIISPARRAAAELSRHLSNGWRREEGQFTIRDVYQNDWSGLDTPERVRAACEILMDADWMRRVEPPEGTRGRPSEVYVINPRLISGETPAAARAPKQAPAVVSSKWLTWTPKATPSRIRPVKPSKVDCPVCAAAGAAQPAAPGKEVSPAKYTRKGIAQIAAARQVQANSGAAKGRAAGGAP